MAFTRKYHVTAHEIDYRYLLTPDGMLLYFQDAVACCLYEHNVAGFDIDKLGLLWIISNFDLHIEKGKRPYWFEEVEVSVSLGKVTPYRLFFDAEMKNAQGSVFATGTSSWSVIDTVSRQPMDCKRILEKGAMEVETNVHSAHHSRLKMPRIGELLWENEHKTGGRDVDQNLHVNNRVYTAAAFNCVPQEIYKVKQVKRITIKYERETFTGDALSCRTYKALSEELPECEDCFVQIISNTGGEQVCTITTVWEPKLKQEMIENHLRNVTI